MERRHVDRYITGDSHHMNQLKNAAFNLTIHPLDTIQLYT